MSAWTPAQLRRFGDARSLVLTAGASGERVELGMVVVGGDVFVRAFRGTDSLWYRAAVAHRSGSVVVGEDRFEVGYEPAAGDDDAIEAAYRERYGSTAAMVATPEARAATLRIVPVAPTRE